MIKYRVACFKEKLKSVQGQEAVLEKAILFKIKEYSKK